MLDRPLEYALVEFKGNKMSGKIVPELLDLAQRGIVRYLDIAFIQRDKDGSTRTVELNDLDPKAYKMFVPLGKHVHSLFSDDDLEIAARALHRNSAAMLLMWENLWAADFSHAVFSSNGRLAERGVITPEVVTELKKQLAAEERKKASAKKRNGANKRLSANKPTPSK